MGIQARTDYYSLDLIRGGNPKSLSNETVVQDGARSGAMVKGTVMTLDPATNKWNSLTDPTATDGTAYPRGILLADLTEAEIQAGDVVDVPILVGDAILDASHITLENSLTLADVINVPANTNTTIGIELRKLGLYTEVTRDVDGFEN